MAIGKGIQVIGAFVEDLENQIKQTIDEADRPEIRLEIGIRTLGISADMLQKAVDKLKRKIDPEKLKELETILEDIRKLQNRTKSVKEKLFPTGEK